MPHHGPKHHPEHGPHGHPHRGWIKSVHTSGMSLSEFAEHLKAFGADLVEDSYVVVNGTRIPFPPTVDFEFVYERNPHGNLVVRFHAEWSETADEDADHSDTLTLGSGKSARRDLASDGER